MSVGFIFYDTENKIKFKQLYRVALFGEFVLVGLFKIIYFYFLKTNYTLQDFFKDVDLDYETETIIRREILPSGKSRAFVNDTPVTLSVLNELRTKLMDAHSQHQTMELSDSNFQFSILDALAKIKLE